MKNERKRYHYKGPVMYFEHVFKNKWEGWCWACSEKQALTIMASRIKKESGYSMSSKIYLLDKYLKEE